MEAPKAARKAVYAMPDQIQIAEQWRQDFVLYVPEDHTVEDLTDPAYWAHVAAERALQKMDRVEARAISGEWVAELMVVTAGRNYAQMKLLVVHDLSTYVPKATAEPKHEVRLRGPHKWCVVRKSDGAVIQQGLDTKHAAEAAMTQYESTIS